MKSLMIDSCSIFPWSDNWYIENSNAWFVLGMHSILCRLDLNTNECEVVDRIPKGSLPEYRLISCCTRFQNSIYCMPGNGSSIWVYDTDVHSFLEIYVDNPEKVPLYVYDLWVYEDKIFAISIGLKQIIEIDAVKKKIDNYYGLCNEGSIARSVKVGMFIYILSGVREEIYKFDLVTKTIRMVKYPSIGRRVNTICFDGRNFWLSGYNKEIYVWNEDRNTIVTIADFPHDFGIYSFKADTAGTVDCTTGEYSLPAFLFSIVVGEKKWFIPFQTNKIIYADKSEYQLHEFEINEDIETKESCLKRTFSQARYIFEYIRENRYLGLYSIKNNRLLEIDTTELRYVWLDYCFNDNSLYEYSKLSGNVFYEEDIWDKESYNRILQLQLREAENSRNSIGINIYNKLMPNTI